VLNATFSNISAISWRPVLVVEEAGVPGENHGQATGKPYHLRLHIAEILLKVALSTINQSIKFLILFLFHFPTLFFNYSMQVKLDCQKSTRSP
jgi:hypothetical protein